MQINAMIFFDAPFRGRHVIPLLGVDQTTSLLVVFDFERCVFYGMWYLGDGCNRGYEEKSVNKILL